MGKMTRILWNLWKRDFLLFNCFMCAFKRMNLPVYNGTFFFFFSSFFTDQNSMPILNKNHLRSYDKKYHVMTVYFLSQLQRWMGMIRSAREWWCCNVHIYFLQAVVLWTTLGKIKGYFSKISIGKLLQGQKKILMPLSYPRLWRPMIILYITCIRWNL